MANHNERINSLTEFNVRGDDFGVNPNDTAPYMYYRCPDGRIVFATSEAKAQQRYRKYKKMEPLDEYGEFLPTKAWDPNVEPYRQLFARGGAKEFTLEAILEHGWHRRPPYRGITFPQLEGLVEGQDYFDLECPYCHKRFANLDRQKAQDNLSRHERIAHSDISQNTQLAEALGTVIKAGNGQGNDVLGSIGKVLEMLVESQKQQAELIAKIMDDKPRRGRPPRESDTETELVS